MQIILNHIQIPYSEYNPTAIVRMHINNILEAFTGNSRLELPLKFSSKLYFYPQLCFLSFIHYTNERFSRRNFVAENLS